MSNSKSFHLLKYETNQGHKYYTDDYCIEQIFALKGYNYRWHSSQYFHPLKLWQVTNLLSRETRENQSKEDRNW